MLIKQASNMIRQNISVLIVLAARLHSLDYYAMLGKTWQEERSVLIVAKNVGLSIELVRITIGIQESRKHVKDAARSLVIFHFV
jgi:hypothetical protein